jgi:predicted metal-dependent HD superfamily phosphohydrolase
VALWKDAAVSLDDIVVWWDEIGAYYSESCRFYHSLVHIYDLYSKFECFKTQFPAESHVIVLLTIFYHDIVYDATSKMNEDYSAALFRERFQSVLSENVVSVVTTYILATKNHTEAAATSQDLVLKLFLDLDLSILGSSRERYARYAHEIRLEYKHYENNDYRRGRSLVLKHFLNIEGDGNSSSPRLFATDLFHDLWESSARGNIMWELDELADESFSESIFGVQSE